MENLKFNKTIVIAVLAVLLAGLAFAYDFQSQQAMKKEIDMLKTDIAGQKSGAGQPLICPDCGLMASQQTAQAFTEAIAGRVRGIEGEIITLVGQTLTLEGNRWIPSNETREYKIAVSSATQITYKGKEAKLADIKTGDFLNVMGEVDPFRKEEVVAESIVVP